MSAHRSAIRTVAPTGSPMLTNRHGHAASARAVAAPLADAPLSTRLCDAIAATLRGLSHDIERLGTELSADPDLSARHLDRLQSVDLTAQHLMELARVVGSSDPDIAIDAITLADLRECLLAATSHPPDTSDGDDHA